MKKNQLITVSKLCKILQISESLFKQRWLKKKPPVPRHKSGRSYLYDITEVYNWLLESNMTQYAALLEEEGIIKNESDEPLLPAPAPNSNTGETKTLDVYGAFDRLGGIITKKLDLLENMNGASSVSATTAIKGLLAELRMYQKAIMDMDKELKAVVPLAIVKRHIATILTEVRTDLCSLPFSIQDELAAEDSPEKVGELLTARIEDCLRHTSEKIEHFDTDGDEGE